MLGLARKDNQGRRGTRVAGPYLVVEHEPCFMRCAARDGASHCKGAETRPYLFADASRLKLLLNLSIALSI